MRYSKDVHLIRNGVVKKTANQPKTENASILMVGNIDSRKYKYAVNLFALLVKQKIEVPIHIYGNVVDRKLANTLVSFSNVKLKGFSTDVPYGKYQFLLHTSSMENLSMAWTEALSCGIPIVSFNVGGATEIIDSSNGVLIQPYQIEDMTLAIKSIRSGQMTFARKINLPDEFSWDISSSKYLDVMQADHEPN